MNLQLKQTEIVAALTSYIAGQGINLTNKTVNVVFTAGRKDSGITVAISIEDADSAFAAVPAVITPPSLVAKPRAAAEAKGEIQPAAAVVDQVDPLADVDTSGAVAGVAVAPTTSLFNN